jgi:hypothetical protein
VGRDDPQLACFGAGNLTSGRSGFSSPVLGHSSESKPGRPSRLAREARLATNPTYKDLVAREVAAALEKVRGEETKGEDRSKHEHEASSEPELQYLQQKTKLLEAQLGQAKWMG